MVRYYESKYPFGRKLIKSGNGMCEIVNFPMVGEPRTYLFEHEYERAPDEAISEISQHEFTRTLDEVNTRKLRRRILE